MRGCCLRRLLKRRLCLRFRLHYDHRCCRLGYRLCGLHAVTTDLVSNRCSRNRAIHVMSLKLIADFVTVMFAVFEPNHLGSLDLLSCLPIATFDSAYPC